MAILTGNEILMPYIKKENGYKKSLLSSQHIQMDNGNTLQTAVNEINNTLSAGNSFDFDTPKIIGFRNGKTIHRLFKYFPPSAYNLSINGELRIKIPELVGRQIIDYSARLTASYGCYRLPFINHLGNSMTWIRCLYSVAEWNLQYYNKGEDWNGWTLVVEIYYY